MSKLEWRRVVVVFHHGQGPPPSAFISLELLFAGTGLKFRRSEPFGGGIASYDVLTSRTPESINSDLLELVVVASVSTDGVETQWTDLLSDETPTTELPAAAE